MRQGTVRCQVCASIVPEGDRCPACDEPLTGARRHHAPLEHDTQPPLDHRSVDALDARQHSAVHDLADDELDTGPASLQAVVRIELTRLYDCLQLHEQVLHLAVATAEGHKGLLALTDHRLIFLCLRPSGYRMDSIRFEQLTAVATRASEREATLVLTTFGSTQEFTRIRPTGCLAAIAGYMRERIARIPAVPLQTDAAHPLG
jgi:hypothetical protein